MVFGNEWYDVLRDAYGRLLVGSVELHTLLVEIESIINCRPLTFVYND